MNADDHYDLPTLRRWHLDQLDTIHAESVESHLTQCDQCAALVDQIPELRGGMTDWIEVPGTIDLDSAAPQSEFPFAVAADPDPSNGPGTIGPSTNPPPTISAQTGPPAASSTRASHSIGDGQSPTTETAVGSPTDPTDADGLQAIHRTHRDSDLSVGDPAVTAVAASSSREHSSISTIDNHDRWLPQRMIARGGIGEVWLAKDKLFNQRVVIKRLRQTTAPRRTVQARLMREADLTAEICHPGTVTVLDRSDAGPNSYYVMTLVEGVTLHSLIEKYHHHREAQQRGWTSQLMTLVRHFLTVADTLAYAHLRGIIHRDVKSENVVVGEFGQVTLIDWGLAKRVHEDDLPNEPEDEHSDGGRSPLQTIDGSRMGTPAFMSPEQIRGENATLSPLTDVYSLSAMLFEIVTGHPPLEVADCDELFDAVLTRPPRTFTDFGIFTLPGLQEIVTRGLAKRPEDRFADAGTLAEQVRHWLSDVAEREHNNRLRERFFSLTGDMMLLLGDGQSVRWANPAVCEQLGWQAEDLVGQTFADLAHPDDASELRTSIDRLMRGGSAGNLEPRMRTASGSYKWCLWTASHLVDEGLTYVVGRNVHDRHEREATRRTLLDGAPDALIAIDRDRVIRFANRQCTTLFGYDKRELIGQRLETLLPERFHAHHPSLVQGYASDPHVRALDESRGLVARHRDGHEVPVRISLSPVETPDGPLYVAAVRQVTQT